MKSLTGIIISIVTYSFLLSSCAFPVKNINADYKLSNQAGVMVASLTISDECAQGKGHGYAYFTEIREINTQQTYSLAMQTFASDRDWVREYNECSTDRNNYYGKLIVIELPAGQYEIYQFEGITTNDKMYSENDLSISFTVKENKVNYLGNMHYHLKQKKYIYSVGNKIERDMSVFYKKYPQFKKQDILVSLLRLENEIK